MGSCPPMDGTVHSLDPDIAQAILNFLVDNDLSMKELMEALVICHKVDGLPQQVKDQLAIMRAQYEETIAGTTPLMANIAGLIGPWAQRYAAEKYKLQKNPPRAQPLKTKAPKPRPNPRRK